jgi:hypothetical protein
MSKKKKKDDNLTWRCFNVAMPEILIPKYNYLQDQLNLILSDEKVREDLKTINLDQGDSYVWGDIRDLKSIKAYTDNWDGLINNKSWHILMLIDNIKRELESKKERKIIWDEYVKNDKELDGLREILIEKHNIYPKAGVIRNMVIADKEPELPKSMTFQMDYSISAKQMFYVDPEDPYMFHIQMNYLDGEYKNKKPKYTNYWFSYKVYIPTSIRHEFIGDIAKVKFVRRKKDGRYIGICSYKCKKNENISKNKKVLGIDIGQKHPYTGVILEDGEIGDQMYHPSSLLYRMSDKLENLKKERNALFEKKKETVKYRSKITERQKRRNQNYKEIRNKISRMQEGIASQIGHEVVDIARNNNCSEIHIENLSWLDAKGGKWNHSAIFQRIKEIAELYNIEVINVNAKDTSKENPITKEIGKVKDRDVVFEDGLVIDRDLLGATNIAIRNAYKQKNSKINEIKKPQRKKTKLNKSRRKEIKEKISNIKKRDDQIVSFLHDEVKGLEIAPQTIMAQEEQIAYNSVLDRYINLARFYVPVNYNCK